MNVSYDPTTDTLYIRIGSGKIHDSVEVEDGIIVDYDRERKVIGIEFLDTTPKSDYNNLS